MDDVHVSIYVPLLQLICIFWEKKNSQHSMLDNPENKIISIHNYYQEKVWTFMLGVWLFITRSSALFYLKVIANIQR